jgi:hypothetical protein
MKFVGRTMKLSLAVWLYIHVDGSVHSLVTQNMLHIGGAMPINAFLGCFTMMM